MTALITRFLLQREGEERFVNTGKESVMQKVTWKQTVWVQCNQYTASICNSFHEAHILLNTRKKCKSQLQHALKAHTALENQGIVE
jgi:hypothetical protein